MLSIKNHDRDVVGLTYVYPVISRRAGGVSVGINLNPNNRCNWHCIYCQVPELKRGVAPATDLVLLEQELDGFLSELVNGSYMSKYVPESCRQLCDLALSGNGEPTTCPNFAEVVALVLNIMDKYALDIPLRLISNGSAIHKTGVQAGLLLMAAKKGEVWFKVDAIGEQMTRAINGVALSAQWQLKQLQKTAELCPTWLQTCVLSEQSNSESFADDYLAWLKRVVKQGIQLQGVLLYGLARPSMQENGDLLRTADSEWLQDFAQKIESLGLIVKVS